AGDVNGDGIDDLIIGAAYADLAGSNSSEGKAYVIFGRTSGFSASLDPSTLDGSNGFFFNGIGPSDLAGWSVSGAGDVNGDGISDLIIGALLAEPGGAAYVVFGHAATFPPSLSRVNLIGSNGFVIDGIDAGDRLGRSASGAGDVNGDGVDDLVIGAPSADPVTDREGESYVVFGNGAPLRVGGTTSLLFDELEDDVNPSGSRLDFSVALSYLDADAFGGLAVVGDTSIASQGRWQFSQDGVSWQDLPGPLSNTSALVLNSESWLRFVPASNFTGRPGPLSVRLWDGRWRNAGTSVDISTAVGALGGFANDANLLDVTLNLMPVNDAPIFTASNPPAVSEDPGGVTVPNWSAFNPGPGETDQFALAYQVENISNPGLFSVLPTVGTLGNLVYDTRQDISGASSFDVRVVDSGGTANGGVNVSGFQRFTISVNPVNDPPNLLAQNPPATRVDAGPQTVVNWAQLDAGAADESNQAVTVEITNVSNPALFSAPPQVDAGGTLRYTPATQAVGTSTFTVVASDNGGLANGGQDTAQAQTFEIIVRSDVLFANSFE
ncbi:MAG: Ig-like domain-containing protein, partial [Cyanobacteria bacterium P01_F01_bin.153]